MEKLRSLSLDQFNIQNLSSCCNIKGCSKKPEKEIFIYEYTIKRRKGIVTVYLCKDHTKDLRTFMRKLRDNAPKMLIEKSVYPIEKKGR
ncbi:hypothetical protein ACFLQN_01610 [Candidatus Aenigmatarchaeota archaeon]